MVLYGTPIETGLLALAREECEDCDDCSEEEDAIDETLSCGDRETLDQVRFLLLAKPKRDAVQSLRVAILPLVFSSLLGVRLVSGSLDTLEKCSGQPTETRARVRWKTLKKSEPGPLEMYRSSRELEAPTRYTKRVGGR